MHPIRWRKAWRDLRFNGQRTILVILSIAVGVFAFGVIIGAREMIGRELRVSYQAINPAHATLFTQPFPQPVVDSIRQMPNIAAAEGRRVIPARVQTGPNSWNDLHIVVVEDFSTLDVNVIRPESGEWPPPERQILLERNSLFLINEGEGESALIRLPDGTERAIPIAGLTHDMNQPPAQIFGIAFGYVSVETLEWLGFEADFNQLQIRVVGDHTNLAHVAQVTAEVEAKLERSGLTVQRIDIPEPDTHFAEDFLPTVLLVLTILGTLSLLLSGFLILNTITAILKQQVRQIGILKAIGGKSAIIVGLYFRMIVILGLCSLLIAIPLGAAGAYVLTWFLAGQLNIDLGPYQIQPTVIAAEVAAGLLVPLLASVIPIISTTSITIREAISDNGLDGDIGHISAGDGADSWLAHRRNAILNQIFSRPLRLSLRNTFRRRGRLTVTLLTLVMAGAIFISVMTVRESLFATLEETLGNSGFDIQIRFGRLYREELIIQQIAQLDGIEAIEGWRALSGVPIRDDGREGEELIIHAIPHDTQLFQANLSSGRWFNAQDSNAVVIHRNLLPKEPHLELGSTLRIKINGQQEDDWTIVGITQDIRPPIGPSIVYINLDHYARLTSTVHQTDSAHISTTLHDEATHVAVTQAVEKHLEAAGFRTVSNNTASDDRAVFTERFNIVTVVLTAMASLIALVGSLGLMGTMTINVIERKREIGVMRAIGAADRAIISMFMVEGIMIGLLSWIGAMILAQPMSRAMSYQIGLAFLQLPLNYDFSFLGAALWLVVVIVLSILASYLPSRNAAQIRIRETLAYE